MSYDTPFGELASLELSKDYKKVLYYEGGCEENISTGDITRVANVFHCEEPLKAIGTYTTSPNQNLIIEIMDVNFEDVLYSQTASYERKGYHTVTLDKISLPQDYAIAISYEGSAPAEGPAWDEGGIKYKAGINPSESYVYLDEQWFDLAYEDTLKYLGLDFMPNNCCIKALSTSAFPDDLKVLIGYNGSWINRYK